MFFFFLWPLQLNTPLTKCIFTSDLCSVLILRLGVAFSMGKLVQNSLIMEYSSAHIWSHLSIGIYHQMSISTSQCMNRIILLTHGCRVVMRVENEEDCVLRIADEIRTNEETPPVAASALMCKNNPGSQFLIENSL